ncbi:MAG: VOC family protein [Planctomycetota bacterium]|jgi:predicted enzyme related to lactoylglutathione lyase
MSEESATPQVGAICHIEIAAADLDASKKFYNKYFGWEFTDHSEGYSMFDSGPVGGGLDCGIESSGKGTTVVLTVPDVKEMLGQFEADGVKVLTGYTEIDGGHGYYAYFTDPAGNKMGIWSKTPST